MIDFILLILLLYLILVGAYRGFVELFIKSVGAFAGIFLGLRFSKDLSTFLSPYFKTSPIILDFLSFSLVVITFFSLSFILYFFVKSFLYRKKKFSLWDRLIGAFGGVAIFFVVVLLVSYYSGKNKLIYDLTNNSKIISFFQR
ncbi:Colicin V production protein [Persephonella hydrogeniphila]|uniref:Colicin V production protein n=1 Tax=Persephonella hydrogeniphila TaxID=198703 RepID=A0A285N9Y5_9AQUI|nr:CvpA family protein [Persephonella hydrogeniphila]SNZ06249.1 Colicin V production protein [Persephonella hydrogeniphila]